MRQCLGGVAEKTAGVAEVIVRQSEGRFLLHGPPEQLRRLSGTTMLHEQFA